MPISTLISTGTGTKDYSSAAIWDGGVPVNADDVYIVQGVAECEITSGMDQSAVDPASWKVGRNFQGKIGRPADPLKLGTVTKMVVDAGAGARLNLWPAALTDAYIYNCGSAADACHFVDGAITDLYILGGQNVVIGAGIVVANVYAMGGAVHLESGATVSTLLRGEGATVYNEADIAGDVELIAGELHHASIGQSSTADIDGVVRVYGGIFRLNSEGADIDEIHVYRGGTFDGRGTSYANTLNSAAAGSISAGGHAYLNDQTTITNAFKCLGGYSGPQSGVSYPAPAIPV